MKLSEYPKDPIKFTQAFNVSMKIPVTSNVTMKLSESFKGFLSPQTVCTKLHLCPKLFKKLRQSAKVYMKLSECFNGSTYKAFSVF